jgi:ATP-dependent DNA helicase RecG
MLGVDPDFIERMKKDFASTVNSPDKLSPPCQLSLQEVEVDDRTLLHVCVPSSSDVHRCRNRIYLRNEDGDYDITDNRASVLKLYMRKLKAFSENTIYKYVSISDLRPDVIETARKRASVRSSGHPWPKMSDEELLKSSRLIRKDPETGEFGLTQAAILLFGRDDVILTILSHFRIDAILRRVNLDRYDDRDLIQTNLLDSYERLIAFGNKHLKDPFFLEGMQRISLRSIILREIASNLLIHQEYSDIFTSKFVIERQRLFTENGNVPHGHGLIDAQSFTPYSKNPMIASVFREIGLADELGSGVRRLFKYSKSFGGHDVEMIEDEVFRLVLPLSDGIYMARYDKYGSDDTSEKTSEKTSVETSEKILFLLRGDGRLSASRIASQLGITSRAVELHFARLKAADKIRRIGAAKGGHWEVLE